MCHGCFKQVSSKFQKRFQGFYGKIDECFEGLSRMFQGYYKGISKKMMKSLGRFMSVSRKLKGYIKCINSLPKKVCFVVVVWNSSQLPEQKESLFSQESRTSSTTLTKLNLSLARLSLSPSLLYLYKYKDMESNKLQSW